MKKCYTLEKLKVLEEDAEALKTSSENLKKSFERQKEKTSKKLNAVKGQLIVSEEEKNLLKQEKGQLLSKTKDFERNLEVERNNYRKLLEEKEKEIGELQLFLEIYKEANDLLRENREEISKENQELRERVGLKTKKEELEKLLRKESDHFDLRIETKLN